MANISAIKLPNGTTYNIKDNGALQLIGGQVTGPVTFGDSVSIDEATLGDLVVNGSASFTNNIQANTINGVTVGNSPKFTDTVTTVTTSGSGNAVTAISASNGAITVTKGSTFLTGITSSQVTTALGYTPYNSTNPNGYTTNTGTVTKVTAGTGLSIGTTAGGNFTTSGTINHTNSVTAQTTQAVYPIKIDAQGHISAYGSAVTIPTVPSNIVNTITTTAGAHTAITSQKGSVSFNVPTKTSHLTNDSGFIKTNEYFNLDLPIVYEYTYTAQLTLGNSNSNSTSSGSSGSIKLYGDSSYYGILVPKLSNGTISLTANRSWGLPDKSGRIALIEEVSSLVTAGTGLSSSLFEYGDDIEGIKHVRLKANLNSETSLGTIGTTSKLYAVGVDSNGQLCVNVPWTNVNSSYLTSSSSLNAAKLTGTVPSSCYTNTNTTYSLSGALSSHKFTSTLTAGGSGSGTSTSDFTLAAGTGITITDDTSARKMTIACSVTNTDEKVKVTALTSGTLYYPILATGTGTATRQIDSTLNGLTYKSTAGTTSVIGTAVLSLGNNTAQGTANNEEGVITLYSNTQYYATLVASNLTQDRSLVLPDKDGTLATTSELLDITYPIGSYYETSDSDFNPNLDWGGYWVDEEINDNKIVEEGKTNDWTYRKWSSGVAECWKTVSLSSNSFSATGNVYYRTASGYSFPLSLFNVAPTVNVNSDMGNIGSASATNITTSSFAFSILSAVSTSRSISLSVYAIGTWKTYEAPFPIYKWIRLA